MVGDEQMSAIVSFLWDKVPGWFRWLLVAGFFLFYTPIKVREELIYFIDGRVHAVVTPLKEKRDIELASINDTLKDVKEDTRDIKRILMERK